MAGSMVYRLEVGDADAPHMVAFRAAMEAAQRRSDNNGYNFIAGFHGAPAWFCWHHQRNPRTPLQARLFLPWHRAYLWWLEQALQDRAVDLPPDISDHDIALPWWDWTVVAGIPAAYEAPPLDSTRARVPNANPPIDEQTTRDPGGNPFARLPAADEIYDEQDGVLADTDFASFSDRLENFHDEVHGWVGGSMGDVTVAAYDPIFFAHHCMIDRLFYLWQVANGSGGIPVDLLDLSLIPFGLRVRDVLDAQRLGYEYATTATPIPVNG